MLVVAVIGFTGSAQADNVVFLDDFAGTVIDADWAVTEIAGAVRCFPARK